MAYWVHRNESDINAATPLLRRGYLSIGWSALATRGEDILELARKDDPSLKGVVEDAYRENYQYTNLKHFALFAPGDIVVVPLEDNEMSIYRIEEAPIPITEYPLVSYDDVNDCEISRADDGLLLRNIERREPVVVDIGYVAKVKRLTARFSRYEANEELRTMMGLQPTNNNIDRLGDEVDRLIAEYES